MTISGNAEPISALHSTWGDVNCMFITIGAVDIWGWYGNALSYVIGVCYIYGAYRVTCSQYVPEKKCKKMYGDWVTNIGCVIFWPDKQVMYLCLFSALELDSHFNDQVIVQI